MCICVYIQCPPAHRQTRSNFPGFTGRVATDFTPSILTPRGTAGFGNGHNNGYNNGYAAHNQPLPFHKRHHSHPARGRSPSPMSFHSHSHTRQHYDSPAYATPFFNAHARSPYDRSSFSLPPTSVVSPTRPKLPTHGISGMHEYGLTHTHTPRAHAYAGQSDCASPLNRSSLPTVLSKGNIVGETLAQATPDGDHRGGQSKRQGRNGRGKEDRRGGRRGSRRRRTGFLKVPASSDLSSANASHCSSASCTPNPAPRTLNIDTIVKESTQYKRSRSALIGTIAPPRASRLSSGICMRARACTHAHAQGHF